MERAQRGDPEAFDRLTELMMDRLFSVAFRILRNTQSAEDATQQALLAIWRQLPQLRDADRFEAWCYRLLVNASYAEHRRHGRSLRSQISSPTRPKTRTSRSTIEIRSSAGSRRLSAEQRAVLVLQHYLNLSHAQMADVLGVPVGTVRSRLHWRSQCNASCARGRRPAR